MGYDHFADREPFDAEGNPSYPIVSIVVPGERYRLAEAREALALAGRSIVALPVAGGITTRRRPE